MPVFRVPDIAAGMGERKPAAVGASLASRTAARPPAAPGAQRIAARPAPTVSRAGAPSAGSPALRLAIAPTAPARAARVARLPPFGAEPPIAWEAPIATEAPLGAPPRVAAARPINRIPAAPVLGAQVRPAAAAALAMPGLRPVLSCGSDEGRIQNYAARMVQNLDLSPSDDLQLFEPNGTPRPNLARVLLSMSAVELGLLHAGVDLIAGAVERATLKAAEASAPADRDPAP